jgi:ribosomal protein S18 acetylase RimI-like enzyme
MIRPATLDDLNGIVALEEESFESDRISRASYRRLLNGDTATIFVDVGGKSQSVRGCAVVLYRMGLAMARLYSLAVSQKHRGKGIARALFDACVADIVEHDRLVLRLEVRTDNAAAIALYERCGCRRVGEIPEYYEDGASAYRFEKQTVINHRPPISLDVPYHAQTTEFTCGTACLIMAMRHFQPKLKANRELELDLWRDSTTIFLAKGVGGCSAEGLALTAHLRGFDVKILASDELTPFVDTVRDPKKKAVIELVHASFRRRLKENKVAYEVVNFGKADIIKAIDKGYVPLLLISGYRLYREKLPHWVVATGYDSHFIYIHDPYVGEALKDFVGQNVPIHERDFMGFHRWGKSNSRMMLLIKGRREMPKVKKKRGAKALRSPQ